MTNSGLVPVLYIMPISALQGLGTCVGCRTSVRVDVWQIRVDSVLELRSLCNKTCRVVVSRQRRVGGMWGGLRRLRRLREGRCGQCRKT